MRTDDYLAPRYLISVEGTSLKSDVTDFVSSVEFEETEDLSSKITLDVANQGFRFLDDKVFAEGNKIDLWMGYVSRPMTFMNRGIIVKPNPGFPRSGIPRLSIVSHDESRKLMHVGKKDKGKTYRKMRDSEIVAKILEDVGIAPFVTETKGLKTRTRKKGTTQWEFLKTISRLNGYVLDVRYDPTARTTYGYFGPQDSVKQEEKFKFSYGTGEADATLLEFWPDLSLPSQETKIEVTYTDAKTRKSHRVTLEVQKKDAEATRFVGASGATKLQRPVKNGPAVTLTVFGQREEVVADRFFASPADAKRFAAAWWHRRQREFVFGRGTLLGVASVRRGQVHEFKGLGPRLSGDWQITGTTHRMQGGSLYEVEFTANKVVLSSLVSAPGNVANVRGKETSL